MKKIFLVFFLSFFAVHVAVAQELNVKVTVNSDKIEGVSKDLFARVQASLMQLMNEQKWTELTYNPNEKIECSFVLTVSGVNGTTYSGDIQITSRRPVYNSAYTTTVFNFRDMDVSFDYTEGQQLEYNQTMATNNLVSIMSFYAYIIIGLDFDSFSLNGGRPFFEQAMNIANYSQSMPGKGWAPFESDKNRYSLVLGLTEESSRAFHPMWYNYHRKGLDEMAANSSRGRIQIIKTLEDLNSIYEARPASVLISMYADTKLTELISILEKATEEEKKESMTLLNRLFPTKSSAIDKLKK